MAVDLRCFENSASLTEISAKRAITEVNEFHDATWIGCTFSGDVLNIEIADPYFPKVNAYGHGGITTAHLEVELADTNAQRVLSELAKHESHAIFWLRFSENLDELDICTSLIDELKVRINPENSKISWCREI